MHTWSLIHFFEHTLSGTETWGDFVFFFGPLSLSHPLRSDGFPVFHTQCFSIKCDYFVYLYPSLIYMTLLNIHLF